MIPHALPAALACDAPPPPPLYEKTAHACRRCGARVLRSGLAYSCSSCDATPSAKVDAICGCGMLTGPRTRASLFRCGPNPTRSPSSPAEVVILFGDNVVAT